MAAILSRIAKLDLPADDFVIIGSGLLDVLNLRASHDIDVAVAPDLFQRLQDEGVYQLHFKNGDPFLVHEDVEVWQGWNGDMPYAQLKQTAVMIEGVWFVHPDILIQRKKERGLEKDLADIVLLEEYRRTHEL